MKNIFLTLLLTLISLNTFGQNSDRTYLSHNHNYSTIYSYAVTEITIHSDATFTWKSWDVNRKKEWKSYKEQEPTISKGKITLNGKYYILTQYRNGNKTDFNWTVKFNDKRLIFFYLNKNKKLKRGTIYKRIR